ncbi:hypothetical protein ACS0TY_018215 [Phlomoides rotata]
MAALDTVEEEIETTDRETLDQADDTVGEREAVDAEEEGGEGEEEELEVDVEEEGGEEEGSSSDDDSTESEIEFPMSAKSKLTPTKSAPTEQPILASNPSPPSLPNLRKTLRI